MITKHEAERLIEEQQAEIVRLEAELTEEITKSIVVFKENHILKARVRELESQLEAKLTSDTRSVYIASIHKMYEDKARECIEEIDRQDDSGYYQIDIDKVYEIIRQKFNLGE